MGLCQNAPMAQATLVVMVRGAARDELCERVKAGPFEHRSVPHSVFSVRGAGVTATLYESGKLVVQGADAQAFVDTWVEGAQPVARAPRPEDAPVQTETTVGSDESGKGDFFGPLVVAAVRATPEQARMLGEGEVRDSKRVSDASALRLGGALRAHLPHAVVTLEPEAYNARYEQVGNLNPLLAAMHAEAIAELAEPGMAVVVDQFARQSVMERALKGVDVKLVQRTRAEELPVVAAASLIAREQFLLSLRSLSEECGVDLVKGAGEPVDRVARALVELRGFDALAGVAKLHFKNTAKLSDEAEDA